MDILTKIVGYGFFGVLWAFAGIVLFGLPLAAFYSRYLCEDIFKTEPNGTIVWVLMILGGILGFVLPNFLQGFINFGV